MKWGGAPPAHRLMLMLASCLLVAESTANAEINLMAEGSGREADVARAAQSTLTRANPIAGAVDPDRYRVGPGDVILVHLSGALSKDLLLTIGPEGSLYVPGYGSVPLDGLTLTEARAELRRSLAQWFKGVQADVRLEQVRTMRVYLVGDVKQPGGIEILATSRVSDALTGRELLDGASRRNVEVQRRDGSRLIADLELFFRAGHTDLNPDLQDGDIIRVPAAVKLIQAHGALARPGRFELGPNDSLHTLVELAGGILPSARRDRALLVRPRTGSEPDSIWTSLDPGAPGAVNPILRDGDQLFVYFVPRYNELEHASILGDIRKPGAYPLRSGQTRLSDLVLAAGGFLPEADSTTIRVYRANKYSTADKTEIERLSKLGRSEMTESEYATFRAQLSARREDFRVDWSLIQRTPELDIVLSDSDLVTVDRIVATVRVDGEVKHPGMVRFAPGRSFEDYVLLAGGYSRRAQPNRARITRAITGQTQLARDVNTISPGDLIWVAEKSDKTAWDHLVTIMAVAAQIATVYIAIRAVPTH